MFAVRILLVSMAFFVARGCDSKIVVDKVPTGGKAVTDGMIYALPNTVIRVQLKVDKTARTGARFAPFAAIFAPDGSPVCKTEGCGEEGKIKYSLQQGAVFSTYGEPDPQNVFIVKFAGKGAIDQNIAMSWTEGGTPSAVSSTVTNRTGDVALSVAKLVVGLGAKAFLGGGGALLPKCPSTSTSDAWVIPELAQADLDTKLQLLSNYCDMPVEDRDKLMKDVALLDDGIKAYVDSIKPLVASRRKILEGNGQTLDGANLLPRIEEEINQRATKLFIGTKQTVTWDGILDVRKFSAGSRVPVLRISPPDGLCLGAAEIAPESKNIPDKFKILTGDACALSPPVSMAIDYSPKMDEQLFTRVRDEDRGERSFRYRVPARVRADLMTDKGVFGSATFFVGQLGTVLSLPASRHSKSLTYDMAFFEATGGLRSFKLGSTGMLDTAMVDTLSGLGGTIIDARNKSADDLNQLTRQNQLLKLQDEICTIQKKYGLPCTVQPQ